ncbi:MAG: exonuclease SbcCD subunit D [Clostridia bacterium]|nr:exonuclease SbcCD subunit D [Clostridia bacterium]
MREIKILHMADIHFGRPASGLPENLRDIRRQEVRSAFSAAISYAKEHKADAVLIAGDLFDFADADKSTINFVIGEFAKIKDIPVLIAPGNHDPLGSAYNALSASDCPNVTVFTSKCEAKTFPEKNFAVYGVGFDNEVVNAPLLKKIKVQDENMVNIALVHGELAPKSDYNPLTEADIAATGMDYIALGHVHTYSGIKKSGNTYYAYCGALEGGGFDECGDKGVIFGTVSKDRCALELIPLSRRRYHTIEVDVTGTSTLQEIIEKVLAVTENKDDLYKIALVGERPEKIPPNVIENEIGAFFAKTKDLTRGAYNLKEISVDYTIGGIFAKNVLERMENADENEKADLMRAADIVLDILSE